MPNDPAASKTTPAGFRLLISPERLREKIAADPDMDCDAGLPAAVADDPLMCLCGSVTERECSEAPTRLEGCEVPDEH